tara:strand:+ start:5935 stop:8046 length:2112 start_codon:yes stop_codon:yes gene_type:complete
VSFALAYFWYAQEKENVLVQMGAELRTFSNQYYSRISDTPLGNKSFKWIALNSIQLVEENGQFIAGAEIDKEDALKVEVRQFKLIGYTDKRDIRQTAFSLFLLLSLCLNLVALLITQVNKALILQGIRRLDQAIEAPNDGEAPDVEPCFIHFKETLDHALGQSESVRDVNKDIEHKYRLVSDLNVALFDGITDAVFQKNLKLEYLKINQVFAALLNLRNTEDVIGKTDFHLDWSVNDRHYLREMQERFVASEQVSIEIERAFEVRGIGQQMLRWRLTKFESNGESYILGVIENITGIKRSENQVRALNQDLVKQLAKANRAELEIKQVKNHLSNIIDSMPSVLVAIDLDGTVTQWNRQATYHCQLEKDEAVGQSLIAIMPELEPHASLIEQALKEQATQKVERVKASVGERNMILNIMVYPLISQEVSGAVVRIDDVTSQVRLEDMMVQTEKMMSVGGLAAGMAHEINNPLGGILQGMQTVRRRLSDRLPKNAEVADELGFEMHQLNRYLEERGINRFFDNIVEAGERAASIVDNMLNFSRKNRESGQLYDVNKLLDTSIELAAKDFDMKKRFDFRNIELIREYGSELPRIPLNSGEIVQVLLNLLKNAAQAMQKTEHPSIHVSTRQNHGYIDIVIQDNGPGMSDEIRKRVFEPFYTTKGVGDGTGLGLSVSYFIIHNNHKGKIDLDTKPGDGAKFTISLPID